MSKFLNRISGRLKQVTALIVSTGATDANKIIATDASGRIDSSLMPVGIGADTAVMIASETLAAGAAVNVWNDAGTRKARNADATTEGKECHGFVNSAVTSGANATVFFEGRNTALTGLVAGTRMYLATTPGQLSATPMAAAGNVDQLVGIAISATELNFEPEDPVTLS